MPVTKVVLKRGFKANSERLAIQYRESLNIHPCAPLCAFALAEYLKISVYNATEFLSQQTDINLLSGANGNDCEWSALTMITKAGNQIIIFNPFHSLVRQQSDLMHELAHIICNHERHEIEEDVEIPFGMRSYDAEQEEEAKCLGATLHLAKPCLLWAKNRNMSYEEIAAHFNASKVMVTYRMNMTGIAKLAFIKRNATS